jgi:hypothetical protein
MSSKDFYHESKFNWNISKQKKCYARYNITSEARIPTRKDSWWKEEMVKEAMTLKTYVLGELEKCAVFVMSTLTRPWSYILKTLLGNGVSRPT